MTARRDLDAPPRFFFGRYTGATLGGGEPPTRGSDQRVPDLASELREMEGDIDAIANRDDARTMWRVGRKGRGAPRETAPFGH